MFALVVGACAHANPPIRIGTSGDYPPFSKHGEGFDVALAEQLADDLGRQIEWVPFRWPTLAESVEGNEFDVAMSGITWRPERAVTGYMTRAVAASGPCVVGAANPARIAVNRGGILEAWTRSNYPSARVVTTDDNLSLPQILAAGEADAFVTDSVEVGHLGESDASVQCEPPTDRKVYWVTNASAETLGPRIDTWLDENESVVAALHAAYLGPYHFTDSDHLADLIARRMAFMPAVAAWKKERGLPIEDLERERKVLAAAKSSAIAKGFDAEQAEAFFALQIALAKAVQRRSTNQSSSLRLGQIRPVLITLGTRIVNALAALRDSGQPFDRQALYLLEPYLDAEEIDALGDRIDALTAKTPSGSAPH